MFCKNAAIITISSMLIAPTAYAGLFDSSNTQTKPGININNSRNATQNDAKPASTQANNTKSSDNTLTKIQNMIENKYKQYNVNVKVHQSTVVLRGYVENDQMKQNIENDVRKIQGIKNVTNLLNIKPESL